MNIKQETNDAPFAAGKMKMRRKMLLYCRKNEDEENNEDDVIERYSDKN